MLDQIHKRAYPSLLVAAVTVIVALIAVNRGSSDSGSFTLHKPPPEFLYLDGPRMLNYLAELEGGSVGKIRHITKEIKSIKGTVSLGEGELGASAQHESEADSTITRTETSELGLLLSDLRSDQWPGVSVHAVSLEKRANLKHIDEGSLVWFRTKSLISPGYIRPYVVVRQSATLAALFPRAPKSRLGSDRVKLQRKKAEAFAKKVGPDPRITFAIAAPREDKEGRIKILLPMHYLGLTTERSLLEKGQDKYTGGELGVIGKVIRVFDDTSDGRPEYTDWATRETWQTPLEQASNFLINHVSHGCATRHTRQERKRIRQKTRGTKRERKMAVEKQIKGRACLLRKLKRQTTLYAPGAVILPLAVFK